MLLHLLLARQAPLTTKKKLNERTDKKKKQIKQKLGQYSSIAEKSTDINGGVPSEAVEKIIFRNMMRIMLEEFKRFIFYLKKVDVIFLFLDY